MPRLRTVMLIVLFVCCAGTLLVLSRSAASTPPPAADGDMVAAAQAFLKKLSAEERTQAQYPFESEERLNWNYVPLERNGLTLKVMSPAQREAAHALMKTALSARGYETATNIMVLDSVLKVLENGSPRRDPEKYYFTIFGTPSEEAPWGWRLEGHHLSLNFSSVSNALSVTPAFLGSNPAEVRTGGLAGWRVLAEEEDRGHALLHLLTDAQRAKAIIATEAPGDIIASPDRQARLERMEGLPASEMTQAQRDTLVRLVETYVYNMQQDIADVQMEKIRQAGLENLYFAWAGGMEDGEGQYYRIQGPTMVIEFDNTQNDANHIHTVWRDAEDDFGEDLLRRHYEQSPHHQHP